MEPALILFLLRLLAALLLLGFLGGIGWLMFRDIRIAQSLVAERERQYGTIRVLDEDEGSELVYPLLPVTSLGRASSNNIVLGDHYASGEHALLMLRGRQWWLEDLNSRNGTLLNGEPLEEMTIVSPGDIITIGSTRLKLEPVA